MTQPPNSSSASSSSSFSSSSSSSASSSSTAAAAAAAATSSSSSSSSSTSLRFLSRPPSYPQKSDGNRAAAPPPADEGVVVVGLLPSYPADSAAPLLLNRLLDRCAFSPGDLHRDLPAAGGRQPNISYYRDKERGVVFVLLQSPLDRKERRTGDKNDCDPATFEDWDLRGALLMFSVCHIIIFLHEGSRFDTHILRKFRMLQRAKNALSPFIRSQEASIAASKPSVTPQIPVSQASSRSPSKTSGGRHSSIVSVTSGSGSQISVLPGHCVPVMLFAFYDEFIDSTGSAVNADDSSDLLLNQPLGFAGTTTNKTAGALRSSGSVVVLARPTNKVETSFRKKLQSSLDSQIRFLIKRCRTLVGSEYGARSVSSLNSSPLFSLDASRAVVLLNKTLLCRGKPLDLVTSRLENVLNSKLTWDTSVSESHNQSSIDDIQVIKDFINRQSDSLRGIGALVTNTTSGSAAAGVGMVAAAAAAAAASAAAGKPLAAPKLPSMDTWESFCNHSFGILFSVKHDKLQYVDEVGSTKKLPTPRKSSAVKAEKHFEIGYNAAEAAISCLQCNRGLNIKFSIEWCKRVLPAAKEIYLRGLPACYPTPLHQSQLEKALSVFFSKVKGPAVNSFAKKLENECNTIWVSGRQLCDAVSLTGKPCMYQRHDDDKSGSLAVHTNHSSGYVFLHACACGRLRSLRDDPFDFYDANISFNCFPSCEKFLPALKFPKGTDGASCVHASWNLVRLGGVEYYDPSKGLLQSGFCGTEKYLSEWKLLPYKPHGEALEISDSAILSSTPMITGESGAEKGVNKISAGFLPEAQVVELEHKKDLEKSSTEDPHVHFSKGFPVFIMKKAFSEVVAGTSSGGLLFPSGQEKKQIIIAGTEKGDKLMSIYGYTANQDDLLTGDGHSEANKEASITGSVSGIHKNISTSGHPFLQTGSNMVPVNIGEWGTGKKRAEKEYSIYVGFEHECPRGHRFFVSENHLDKLGSFYSSPGSSQKYSNGNCSTGKLEGVRVNSGHRQFVKTTDSYEKELRSKHGSSGLQQTRKHHNHMYYGHKGSLPQIDFNYSGHAISLLNRDLPIFMNCPYCENFSEEKQEKINFSSSVSQLQRIFMVTPPFPIVLAASPVIQFEVSNLPASVAHLEKQAQFSLGCRVTLPPESFLSLRLPFVYGVELEDKHLQPLPFNKEKPELTAWLVKGSALNIVSKDFNFNKDPE